MVYKNVNVSHVVENYLKNQDQDVELMNVHLQKEKERTDYNDKNDLFLLLLDFSGNGLRIFSVDFFQ